MSEAVVETVEQEHGHSEHGAVHVHRDDFGAKIGMWLFLFTEVLLFGGLFFLYYAYRVRFPEGFHNAAMELNVSLGALNTFILLTSSLTMALAILALRRGGRRLAIVFSIATIICAFGFLINKYFEWGAKISHHIYPGSDKMLELPEGERIFFGLYYLMTGLHTFHVIVGVVVISFMIYLIKKGNVHPTYYSKIENVGLYWHLVDLIWIFLFPLFYLLH